MTRYISEAVVAVTDADRVVEALCGSLRDCAISVDTYRGDHLMNFGDGSATIKVEVCALHLRVEAEDLATLFGIRSLLQVALARVSNYRSGHLVWDPGGDELSDMIGPTACLTGRC